MSQSFVPSGRNAGSFVPFVEIMFQNRSEPVVINPTQGDQDACPRSLNYKYEGYVLGLGISCSGEVPAGLSDVRTFIAPIRAVS